MKCIERLNKEAQFYQSGTGTIFDETMSAQAIGSHLDSGGAPSLAKDPVQAGLLHYQSKLDQLKGQQA